MNHSAFNLKFSNDVTAALQYIFGMAKNTSPVLVPSLGKFLIVLSILGVGIHSDKSFAKVKLVECGLSGNTDERIEDCQKKNHAAAEFLADGESKGSAYAWKLVRKTAETAEVSGAYWLDVLSHVIWAPALSKREQERAIKDCQSLHQSLPEDRDYRSAETHGIRQVLPEMLGNVYWTVSQSPYPESAYFFAATEREGYIDDGNKKIGHLAQCIELERGN